MVLLRCRGKSVVQTQRCRLNLCLFRESGGLCSALSRTAHIQNTACVRHILCPLSVSPFKVGGNRSIFVTCKKNTEHKCLFSLSRVSVCWGGGGGGKGQGFLFPPHVFPLPDGIILLGQNDSQISRSRGRAVKSCNSVALWRRFKIFTH